MLTPTGTTNVPVSQSSCRVFTYIFNSHWQLLWSVFGCTQVRRRFDMRSFIQVGIIRKQFEQWKLYCSMSPHLQKVHSKYLSFLTRDVDGAPSSDFFHSMIRSGRIRGRVRSRSPSTLLITFTSNQTKFLVSLQIKASQKQKIYTSQSLASTIDDKSDINENEEDASVLRAACSSTSRCSLALIWIATEFINKISSKW